MIKINLLPQRKSKRAQAPGERDVMIGMLVLLSLAVATFFVFHRPEADKLARLQASNARYEEDLGRRRAKIRTLPQLKAAVEAAEAKGGSIEKLIAARAVPAHMLHELGEIMTPGRMPTMTKDMAKRVSDPKDSTYRFREDWDPKHIWITALSEKKGVFTLSGGAESDADVSQLMKRMEASVYFDEVTPAIGEKVTDKDTGVIYYKFQVTGKVVY